MITSINIDGALLLIGSHQKEQVRILGNIHQITLTLDYLTIVTTVVTLVIMLHVTVHTYVT